MKLRNDLLQLKTIVERNNLTVRDEPVILGRKATASEKPDTMARQGKKKN